MKERLKRKKIFYVPGMISLVFIPLFCLYHFYKTDSFKVEGCMSIYFPEDSLSIKKILSFKRDYQSFSFNSSENLESKKLKNLQFSLRELNRTNDTINGVRIRLGNKMKYDVYIRILDIFALEKMPIFLQYKNDFLVLMLPKPKPKHSKKIKIVPFLMCGNGVVDEMSFLESEREKQFQYILSLYKKHWIIFLGYFGIVLLNIFVLVKFNKNK